MPTAGETLLQKMNESPPSDMEDAISDAQPAEPVETPKPRRSRKPKEEAAVAELEPEPAPPDEPQPEPQAAGEDATPEQPEWLRRLEAEAGFQNLTDPNDAGARAVEQLLRQKQEIEEYQRKLRDAEYRQIAAAAQTPEPASTPEQPKKPWQPPVEYPQNASRYLTRNEQGLAEWKPDTPAEVRAHAEKWIAWKNDIAETLLERPDIFFNEILPKFIDEHARKVIEPFYEQKTAQERQAEFFAAFEQQHADWLFSKDPTTGQPDWRMFSQIGQLLNDRVGVHLQRGASPQEALEYAQYDVQRQTGQSPWTPPAAAPDPVQVREQNRQKTLRKPLGNAAQAVPQRSGSFTEPGDGTPQNGNLSPGQRLVDRMRREGIPPPYAAVG